MAEFKNDSVGVINYGGEMIAPGKTLAADESHPGIKRMIKRGVLSKVDGRTKAAKQETKQDAKSGE
ncbi:MULTISPECIES: hypothetical protein [unclassified Halomonas]|uniref:hypothetical protein n=1 Tax=unclassified Halomonas TaxID=2609666 RepID=UPI002076B5DC|nr:MULTISPECIES: hypothetical protein [unclassified Halomonas]